MELTQTITLIFTGRNCNLNRFKSSQEKQMGRITMLNFHYAWMNIYCSNLVDTSFNLEMDQAFLWMMKLSDTSLNGHLVLAKLNTEWITLSCVPSNMKWSYSIYFCSIEDACNRISMSLMWAEFLNWKIFLISFQFGYHCITIYNTELVS
jgi:hypothetical protein